MAKRNKKTELEMFCKVALVLIIIWLLIKLINTIGIVVIALICVSLVAIPFLIFIYKARKRKALLRATYRDEEVVDKIVNKFLWIGETSDQIIASLGQPVDVNISQSASGNKEIWKYDRKGKNRYGLRITLVNDRVSEINSNPQA